MPGDRLLQGARLAHRVPDSGPFSHGVASGDPGPDRLVLWTRVTLAGATQRRVGWVVARDPELRRRVAEGEAVARAEADGCVRIEVTGLPARSTLYYRFSAEGQASRLGRSRTLAPHGLAPVRLAVCHGARHEAGFFHAYAQALQLDDGPAPLDAVLHLGDTVDGNPLAESAHAQLALHGSDPDLQRLRACVPWIGLAAGLGEPALQAWQAWMPLRLDDPARPARLRREFAFGTVLRLLLADAGTPADAASLAREGTLWVVRAEAGGALHVHAADGRPLMPLAVPAVSGAPPGFLLLEASADDLCASQQLTESVRAPEPAVRVGMAWRLPRQGAVLRPGDPRGSRGR